MIAILSLEGLTSTIRSGDGAAADITSGVGAPQPVAVRSGQ